MKKKEAVFIIKMEWMQDGKPIMTAQIARDKLLTALQELWIMNILDKFSIEETAKVDITAKISRERTK